MSKGNSNRNRKKNNSGLTPKELELYIRARREGKALSFARGFPAIVELPDNYLPRYTQPKQNRPNKQNDSKVPAIKLDVVELENGTLLDPVSDLLHMVEALDLYAAQCSDELSRVEHCREDCTHELEFRNQGDSVPLDDQRVLAIGKKLQLISEERRDIKNRFEIVKFIKRAFESKTGQDALQFLREILADENRLRAEQGRRVYTPRTDILDDLYEHPLPKYTPPTVDMPMFEELDDMDCPPFDEGEPYPPEFLDILFADAPEYSAVEPFVDEPLILEDEGG